MDRTEMTEEQINDLIISFLTNDISDNEMIALEKWIKSDSANVEFFNHCLEIWLIGGTKKELNEFNVMSSWELMKTRMTKSEVTGKGNKKRMIIRYIRIAATWLIFFMLGFAAFYLIRQPAEIMPRPVIIEVPLGAKGSIVLPDGSKVWLNAGTKLVYDENYGRKTRSLDLSGEAYFIVAGDKMHPFFVNTAELRIEALGTKFNVKSYPEEPSIMTILEEGKIDIHIRENKKGTGEIVLLPNEKFIYQKLSGSFEKQSGQNAKKNESLKALRKKTFPAGIIEKNINTELYTSWKDKRWIIQGETLDNLAPMLERKYNIQIEFRDDILKYYSFTGTIENETIEQILHAIKHTAPIDFELKRDTVILAVDRDTQDQFKQITKPDTH
ncbi:MAG TPA: FecR family protein [Bacteroidales bacterium]|jgi:ferric-dicitrate binding protein FerR (iron transport regulator)|nr:FecR family protein [Bacteroidales bacterium]